jgi:hypothetical protein
MSKAREVHAILNGDINRAAPRAIHADVRDQVAARIRDRDIHRLANFFCFLFRHGNHRACIIQCDFIRHGAKFSSGHGKPCGALSS